MTGPFNLRAGGEFARGLDPGVGEGLLEAKRDAPLFRLDGEDDGVNAVARLENVAGMADLFAVGHLGDVDEAFDAGLDLDECAEVGDAGYGAGDALAGGEVFGRGLPGLGLKLLEAERDLLGFRVDFEDAEFELLADGEDVFRLGDAGVAMSLTCSRPSMPPRSMNAP